MKQCCKTIVPTILIGCWVAMVLIDSLPILGIAAISAKTNDPHTKQVTTVPIDQGALDVWFEGEVRVTSKAVHVKGMTNLLPGSKIQLVVKGENAILIQTDTQAIVNENGDFVFHRNLPKGVNGILHVEIEFDPRFQSRSIAQHYEEKMSGNFVRLFSELHEMYSVATFQHTVFLEDEEVTFPIKEPAWDIPEDYAMPDIWIEVDLKEQGAYLVIQMKSNIIEGTFLRANAAIPGYITAGFQGTAYTNPDGTAVFYMENPRKDRRIKNLQTYEIVLSMDPEEGKNGQHVREQYGEGGEKLLGEFVKKEPDGSKGIERKIKVQVDEL
ncbi:hypothetical protein [Virgibacillus sp. LDC-1]|uniref:hypothetical protein n=1 Tax=Virgibacillus sp. LDC-1 TaxID=3039856 RepID=UPI0024DEE589|nr:hypothetical protein [Virgibacillus sp. LDC-1]